MQCQECDQPAVFHITEARHRAAVAERHLCEPHVRQYLEEHPPGAEAPARPADPTPGAQPEVRLDPVRVIISEVHDQQLMVLQEVAGPRTFPIVIGIFEATALDRRLKGLSSPRPLTHDAWADTIRALGVQVQDVLIHDLRNHTYYVSVRILQGGRVVAVDVRPSDGIILALTLRVPVLVTERLLNEATGPPG